MLYVTQGRRGLNEQENFRESRADFSMTFDENQGLWDPDLEGGYPANHFAFRRVISGLREERGQHASSTPRLDALRVWCRQVKVDSSE